MLIGQEGACAADKGQKREKRGEIDSRDLVVSPPSVLGFLPPVLSKDCPESGNSARTVAVGGVVRKGEQQEPHTLARV
jgi:hypothetical protein